MWKNYLAVAWASRSGHQHGKYGKKKRKLWCLSGGIFLPKALPNDEYQNPCRPKREVCPGWFESCLLAEYDSHDAVQKRINQSALPNPHRRHKRMLWPRHPREWNRKKCPQEQTSYSVWTSPWSRISTSLETGSAEAAFLVRARGFLAGVSASPSSSLLAAFLTGVLRFLGVAVGVRALALSGGVVFALCFWGLVVLCVSD